MNFAIVTDEDGTPHTECPHCKTQDDIYEKDVAVRWNSLSLVDDGLAAFAATGVGDFDGDGFICGSCLEPCDEPAGFEILDWS